MGLQCEIHVPVGQKLPSYLLLPPPPLESSPYYIELQNAIKVYDKGSKKEVELFCEKPEVLCYLNSKYFPLNKEMGESPGPIAFCGSGQLRHKEQTETLDVSIFGLKK